MKSISNSYLVLFTLVMLFTNEATSSLNELEHQMQTNNGNSATSAVKTIAQESLKALGNDEISETGVYCIKTRSTGYYISAERARPMYRKLYHFVLGRKNPSCNKSSQFRILKVKGEENTYRIRSILRSEDITQVFGRISYSINFVKPYAKDRRQYWKISRAPGRNLFHFKCAVSPNRILGNHEVNIFLFKNKPFSAYEKNVVMRTKTEELEITIAKNQKILKSEVAKMQNILKHREGLENEINQIKKEIKNNNALKCNSKKLKYENHKILHKRLNSKIAKKKNILELREGLENEINQIKKEIKNNNAFKCISNELKYKKNKILHERLNSKIAKRKRTPKILKIYENEINQIKKEIKNNNALKCISKKLTDEKNKILHERLKSKLIASLNNAPLNTILNTIMRNVHETSRLKQQLIKSIFR